MTLALVPDAPETRLHAREAFDELCSIADGATEHVPAELLSEHVLEVTDGGDWPVQRAAMEAILRRLAFAERDELRVSARPKGSPFGGYTLRRSGRRDVRPYSTLLWSVEPPRGACDCPDFARSSLGLCKHLLVALEDACSKPERTWRGIVAPAPVLHWDSIRPLHGAADPLARIRWCAGKISGRTPAALERLERWFAAPNAGERRLKSSHPKEPKRRLELVNDLLAAARLRSQGADPALIALLEAERERLVTRVADLELGRSADKLLRTLQKKLYPYQLEGVKRFLASGRLLLGDDMGLGKTLQATAACHALFAAGRVRRGLILVPASLKSQWLKEWRAATDVPIAVVDGRPEERARQYRELESGFLILNYEQLLRDVREVSAIDADIVVLDEAQRIKNWATKTAVYVKSLTPRYRLILTGTPLENRLDELASLLDWVDDMALAPKWRLAPWHTLWEGDGSQASRVGARNLDTLRARLEPVLLRRVRKQVLSQLPPRTDVHVPVAMTEQQAAVHDELDVPIRQIIASSRRRPLSQPEFLKLMSLLTTQRIASNGLAQLEFDEVWPDCSRWSRPEDHQIDRLCTPKLHELRRLIADLAVHQQRKVVVFSQWRKMLRLAHWAVADVLREQGLRAVFFTGAESQKLRTQAVVELHDDPNTRVMFLTDAGGVGLNLQRAASSCINIELPWNPAVLEQRIGRIYRIGQELPIDVYNLVTEVGIEARIASVVAGKRELFSGLFDGSSDEIRFDGSASFLKQLERVLAAPELPETNRELAALPPPVAEDDAEVGAEDEALAATPSDAAPVHAPSSPAPSPNGATLRELLSTIEVRRSDDGRVTLDAPPEAAELLLVMLEKTAELLRPRA
jgi:hypothetical protein